MKISIVIPAYNEEKYIGRTLESINNLKKNGWDIEVLVIDGDSSDKTPEVARAYGANVVHEPHKGIGFARQEGIKHATGELVFFTDADTIVPPNWVVEHMKALSGEGVCCSYGGFRYYDGTFPLYYLFNYVQPILVYLAYKLFAFPAASGQNIACWKKKALDMGGFNQNLVIFEDTDFAIRMKSVGKVVYLPDLLIYSSGRRGQEGWRFYLRMLYSYFQYFILGSRSLERFPDYR